MMKTLANLLFCKMMKKRGADSLHHLDDASRQATALSEQTLLTVLRENASTEYGRLYHFDEIRSVEDYRRRVPYTTYDDYAPYIERMIRNGEEGLITNSPIRHYAVSSGSVGVPKHIPVSQRTLDIYSMYIANMVFGVMNEFYRDTMGRTFPHGYCLNTVEAAPMLTENGVPKGPISGTLLQPVKKLLKYFMTSPAELIFPTEQMDMKYLKLRFALPERNVICIMAPFMTAPVDLMTYLEENWEALCDDIEHGVIGKDVRVSADLREKLERQLRPDPKRAQELRREFQSGFSTPILPRIWKHFSYVTAIGTGGFSQYTPKMRQYTGKNIPYTFAAYAASEALIATARRTGDESFVLLPNSGFYEFLPVDAKDETATLTIDQVEEGKDYEIIVTNLSGFYRYRIKDVIRVTGFYNEAPMIQFLYRKDQMLSIAGEKTNGTAVRWAISKFQDTTGLLLRDFSVYADTNVSPGRYVVLMEPDKEIDPANLPQYRDLIEQLLGEANPSFGAKIRTGVLGRTRLCITQQQTYMLYRDLMIMKGVSPNQLKPVRVIDTPMKERFFFNLLEMETE